MKKGSGMAVLLVMIFFLQGCGARVTENNLSQLHFVKATAETEGKTPEERASAIKKRLYQMEEIVGCGVVVEGSMAIIGLRLADGTKQGEIAALKRRADAVAKEAEQTIAHTSITTNPYIVAMIEDMERKRADDGAEN